MQVRRCAGGCWDGVGKGGWRRLGGGRRCGMCTEIPIHSEQVTSMSILTVHALALVVHVKTVGAMRR